jgi:hypothetical protein
MATNTLTLSIAFPQAAQDATLDAWRALCAAHRAGAKDAGADFSSRDDAVRLDDCAETHASGAIEKLLRLQRPVAPAKYDDVLLPFVSLMRRELHANSGKGDRPGWLSMTRDRAVLEVYYHLAKLQKAVKQNDLAAIAEYSADVANMSLMVLDICGGISAEGDAQ